MSVFIYTHTHAIHSVCVCVYRHIYSKMETTRPNCHLFHLDLMKKNKTKTKIALQALLLQTRAQFQDNPKRWCNES